MPSLALCRTAARPSPTLAAAGSGRPRDGWRQNSSTRLRSWHTTWRRLGGAVPPLLASGTNTAHTVDADDAWRGAVADFWRGRGCTEREVELMLSTAAVEHSLRDVQFLAGPATILGSLVPGASVAAMVNRAPEVLLRFDLAVACQRLVELRQLCSCDDESLPCAVDSDETATTLCSVSRTLELHPSLLLSRVPIQNMATAAAAHLLSLAPHKVDPSSAFQAVRANPEWLTSLAQYDHYDMLPVAVQNAMTPPWNEWSDIRERVEAYDRAWDIASVGEPQRAQWDE